MEKETPNAELAPEVAGNDTTVVDAPADSVELIADLNAIVEERDRLQREKDELNDQLMRRTADYDNFRKRTERERAELVEYASSDALKALLPILDDFERALKQECADAEYAKGVELIYQRFFDVLKKLGLEPIAAVGKPFDPNFHHAIEMVPTEEFEDQSVVDDLLRGYLFKGRLLRASMVRVAERR
jgi:molecular chaperone GrpE